MPLGQCVIYVRNLNIYAQVTCLIEIFGLSLQDISTKIFDSIKKEINYDKGRDRK